MRARRLTPLLVICLALSFMLHVTFAFSDLIWAWWENDSLPADSTLHATQRKLHSQSLDASQGGRGMLEGIVPADTLVVALAEASTHPVHRRPTASAPTAPHRTEPHAQSKPKAAPAAKAVPQPAAEPAPTPVETASAADAKPADATPPSDKPADTPQPAAPTQPAEPPLAAASPASTAPAIVPGNTERPTATTQPTQGAAFPKQATISYIGNGFVGVTANWRIDGNRYDLDVNLSMFGHWHSTGEIGPQGLRPARYTEIKPKETEPNKSAEFNWQTHVLRVGVRGQEKDCPLKEGAVDILSAGYQFALQGDKLPSFDIQVASGRDCYQVNFAITGETTLLLSGVPVDALVMSGSKDTRRYEFYLAPAWHNLPVRMRYVDGDKKYDLLATQLVIDGKVVLARHNRRDDR